jgi:alpha-tubulin suppressor-like RCC1 family protein
MLSVSARYIRTPLVPIAATIVALLIIFIAFNQAVEADSTAVNVAVGAGHSCAVTDTGGVQCWGDNEWGQLGTNTNDSTAIPVDVCADGACSESLQGVVAITADNDHTCALNEEGGVLCWGKNANGQLGDGSNTDRTTPVGVVGLDGGVEAITAGFAHSCALMTGGGVKCWGENDASQLGNDTTDSSTIPVSVCELAFPKAGEPAGGGPVLPCEPISYATSVSAGSAHTCVVTDEGGVNCWGTNDSGQLGNNTTDDRDTPDEACIPVLIILLSEPAPAGALCTPLSDIVLVSAGAAHTCALESDSGILCWGLNSFGQLGNDTTIDRSFPTEVCIRSHVRDHDERWGEMLGLEPCRQHWRWHDHRAPFAGQRRWVG